MARLAALKAKIIAWTAANPWKAVCTAFTIGWAVGRYL